MLVDTCNMKGIYFIALITLLLFAGCKEQTDSIHHSFVFVDTTKPFKREIPTYQDGSGDLFYFVEKAKQKQLGLDSLENGFSNLQIRVWYDYSLVKQRDLVVITNKDTNWTATVYNLQVDWDGETETIISKQVKQVTPKSGWSDFLGKLFDLKILTLPNMNDIPGLDDGWTDGITYNVEIATKNQYRFYGYHLPDKFEDKYWQAKNMTNILKLFEQEFGV